MSPLPIARPPAPRIPRRTALALALAVVALVGRSEAGDRSAWRPEHERALNVERRSAIRRGCDYIVTRQHLEGSFGDNKALVAFTSLSALALMAEGSSLGSGGPEGARGPHGKAVARAVEWLLKLVEEPSSPRREDVGYFYLPQDSSSKMHGQGYAMLALASALGSADERTGQRIRTVLKKAVACVERSQTGTGGWGYYNDPAQEHEGSVTVTIAQGLRAAHFGGIKVSRDTVVRGLDYLRRSQKRYPPGSNLAQAQWDGSFKYSISTERSTYALTAAAISSFFLFGEYGSRPEDKDGIARGIAFLKRSLPQQMKSREWHFYGHFYAAWAAWQQDGDKPEAGPDETWGADPRSDDILRTERLWGPWHAKVYPDLLRTQRDDGSWEDPNDDYKFGDLLPTAFAVLTLAIPDEMIPVFQR